MGQGDLTEREDKDLFAKILGDAVRVVEDEGIPYAVFGSIAAVTWGRPNAAGDIDFLIQPQDNRRAIKAFERGGYETEEYDPGWLFKAFKDGVLIDLIFKVRGDIYLDDDMIARTVEHDYLGQTLNLLSPEDTVLVEALGTESETPEHWFNAVAIIARQDLDWEYILERSRLGAHRILSLLIFAQSTDVPVPNEIVRRLFNRIYGPHGA